MSAAVVSENTYTWTQIKVIELKRNFIIYPENKTWNEINHTKNVTDIKFKMVGLEVLSVLADIVFSWI